MARNEIARLAVLALAAAHAVCAMAADVLVARPAALRDARFVDARVLQQLSPGTPVELLGIEAGWVNVRAGTTAGWVRATSLGGDGATVAALARLETGRSAANNIVVALGIRRIPKASRLALIIGVDAVAAAGGTRWPGVRDDVESARQMARRMGVPEDNVEVIQGDAARKTGIEASLDRLAQRTQPGDQLFVYFAGPGTPASARQPCRGAWLAADGGVVPASLVASHLGPALVSAGKIFVASDAAYQNASGASGRRFVGNDDRACSAPESLSMPLVEAAREVGTPENNIVHLQAIGGLQGLEQPEGGGLFTQALADCIAGDAADLDASGSISIEEVAACIDQHATHAGLSAAANRSSWALIEGNALYVPVPGSSVIADSTTAGPIRAALDDVLAQRDDRIHVELVAEPPTLAIGKDRLDLRVRSNRGGYVYLILLGSDQKSFYLLFPNDRDGDNRIGADETLRLPRPQWSVESQGPPGVNVLLAVVAESRRDLASLQGRKAGPFSAVLTDRQGRATLQWLLGRSADADSERCTAAGRRRNLQVVPACSDAFGAAVTEINER